MTKDNQIISTDHPDAVTYRREPTPSELELDTLATSIHEDVIWHLPGTTWMARDFKGGEERFFHVSSVMRFSDGRQKERWLHIHDQIAFDEFMSRF